MNSNDNITNDVNAVLKYETYRLVCLLFQAITEPGFDSHYTSLPLIRDPQKAVAFVRAVFERYDSENYLTLSRVSDGYLEALFEARRYRSDNYYGVMSIANRIGRRLSSEE